MVTMYDLKRSWGYPSRYKRQDVKPEVGGLDYGDREVK